MYFLTLLKALATLIVMHSHCDELLPIPALATGGSIEDSFFFAVSGFALYYSVDKEAGDYFKKRVLRVYPAIVIGTLIVMMVMSGVPDFKMICKFNDFTLFGAVKTFLFPTNYHFISAILVLYIIYFVCLHNRGVQKNRILIGVMIALACAYAIAYLTYLDTSKWSIESEPFKYLYWAMAFIVGGLCRGYYDNLKDLVSDKKKMFGICSGILFALFYAVKLLLAKLQLMQFQFVIQIIELLFLFCFIVWLIGYEERLKKYSEGRLWKAVDFLGSITLENYLFMDMVIMIMYTNQIPFPINWILVFPVTFIFSFILHQTVRLIEKRLLKIN